MRFAQPDWLWLLLALPLALLLFWYDERRRVRQLSTLVSQVLWSRIIPEMNPGARFRKALLWSCGIAFAILALARPQWGMREEVLKTTGLDIMVVMDVSNSMQVEDVVPTRLGKAKHLINSLTEKVQGDRIGVVAFAGSAYVAVPLTTDLGYVREVVDVLDSNSISQQGSDLGAGLETARRSLERGSEDVSFNSNKSVATHAILLLTDGEDHEGQVQEAASNLAKAGVRVYVIGIGTSKGGPVPVRDSSGKLVGFKKDRSGAPIVSAFNPDTLMKVASAGSGKYWTATPDERELDELVAELSGMNRAEFAERKRMVWEERFQYPLAVAVLLLMIELCMPARRLAAVLALFLPTIGWSAPLDVYLKNEKGIDALVEGRVDEAKKSFSAAQARDPDQAELEYNQGIVHLHENDMEAAITRFDNAAQVAGKRGESGLAARSLFNSALARTQKGDFKGAAGSYIQALDHARRAGDAELEQDIRKNLELLNQEKQKQQQQAQSQQDGQKEQQDGQGKDQEKQESKESKGDQETEEERNQQFTSRKKPFKSEKLSDEDAERVMAELSNREKELQGKLKKQDRKQGTARGNDKDW